MNNLFHSRFITRTISGKNNWWKQKKARKLFIEKNVDVSDTLILWMQSKYIFRSLNIYLLKQASTSKDHHFPNGL